MSIKTVSLITLTLVSAGVGGTYFTQNKFQSYMNEQIAEAKKQGAEGQVEITFDSVKSNMFSRTDRMGFTLSKTLFDPESVNDESVEDIQFALINTCQVLPLYVDCTTELENYDELVKKFKENWSGAEYDLAWTLNYWLDSQVGSLVINDSTISGEEALSIAITPLNLNYTSDADGDNLVMAMDWKGLAADRNSQRQFDVSSVTMTANMQKHEGEYLLGTSSLNVAQIKAQVTGPKPVNFDLNDLTISSNAWLENDNTEYALTYKVELSDLAVAGPKPLNLKNWVLDLQSDGLDVATVLEAQKLAKQNSGTDPKEVFEYLGALASKGLTFKLNQFDGELNKVELASTGDINLAPFKQEDLAVTGSILTKLQFNFNAAVTENINTEFAMVKPMLDQLQKSEMIKLEEGKLTTHLQLKDGLIIANEKPVRKIF